MDKIDMLADYFGIHFSKLIEERKDTNYFEFIAIDDAMFPLLDVGDIATVHKQDKIDNINSNNKGTYLIILNKVKTIRRIELDEIKGNFTLIAMNAYYKTIKIPNDEFYSEIQILGKVVKAINKSAFK